MCYVLLTSDEDMKTAELEIPWIHETTLDVVPTAETKDVIAAATVVDIYKQRISSTSSSPFEYGPR